MTDPKAQEFSARSTQSESLGAGFSKSSWLGPTLGESECTLKSVPEDYNVYS